MLRGLLKLYFLRKLFGGGGTGGKGGCGCLGLVAILVILVVAFLLLRSCSGGVPTSTF